MTFSVKLLVLLLLVAMLAGHADAQTGEWVQVGTTDDTTYSIDSAGVAATRGGMVDVRIKSAFARTIAERRGDQYDMRIARYRIDCAKSVWRNNEVAYYRGTTLVRRTSSESRAVLYKPLRPQEREMLAMACEIARAPDTPTSLHSPGRAP